MRKFIINVNGNSYEVEVEEVDKEEGLELSGQESRPTPNKVQASKPAPKVTKPKEEKKPVQVSDGQEVVKSPMPGNIWKIVAQEGQEVKAGDVLLILEAMKMENEIVAPKDGKVSSMVVSEGATVNTGDDLVIID